MKCINIEKARKLISKGFGQQLEQIAVNCSAPFFWVENLGKEGQVIHNGTIFFLDTGSHCFAVSAYHVYEAYLQACERSSGIICQIYKKNLNQQIVFLIFLENSI